MAFRARRTVARPRVIHHAARASSWMDWMGLAIDSRNRAMKDSTRAGCPRGARAAAAADRDDVEPIVEVLAERAFLDHLVEVAVRGRDDADVDRDASASPPTRSNSRSCEHAQQLDLEPAASARRSRRGRWCRRSRASKRPVLSRDRAGEGAALVAEELALEQALGERARS